MATVKKQCLGCKNDFDVLRYRADKAKYCSTKCNLLVVSTKNKNGSIGSCKTCSKELYKSKNSKKLYCSQTCLGVDFAKQRKGISLNTGRTQFKKGITTWNKGLSKDNNEIVKKMSEEKLGKKRLDMVGNQYGFTSENMQKERHPMWKGGITPITLAERARFRKTIQKQVFERDDYTCQLCGVRGGVLHVDHIQSWAEYIELRFNMDNCRTLCLDCHYQVTYGKPITEKGKAWGNAKGGIKPRV